VLNPDHTWQKVVFDPWRQDTWDVSDTVLIPDPRTDEDVGALFARLRDDEFLPSWHDERQAQGPGPERTAADKAAIHANTPTRAYVDALGRTFLTIAHNAFKYSNAPQDAPRVEEYQSTRVSFDIEGNERTVIDALDRVVMRYEYDMLGHCIHQASMEAGERWTLADVGGTPIYAWNSRNYVLRTVHDQLRRPVETYLTGEGGAELQVGRTTYGEGVLDPQVNNLRGKVVEVCDQAGIVRSRSYDFKGNLLESERELAGDYKNTLDWSGAVPFDGTGAYFTATAYDALNRPVTSRTPDGTVVTFTYNEAGLLNAIEGSLSGAQGNAQPVSFVSDIDYDAKGQRLHVEYGSGAGPGRRGVTTSFTYDWRTFRLIHLQTTRDRAVFQSDCPHAHDSEWPGCDVQNLQYTYDATGNITHIEDAAQQRIFHANTRVDPSASYTYDAVGRLIEATGREHLGLGAVRPTAPDAFNVFHTRHDHPGNGLAMGRYLERYIYDAVGNILTMAHPDPDRGWVRTYVYREPSQLEPGQVSNRLTSTTVDDITESYRYEGSGGVHGNITFMPHLSLMQWDYRDQLQATSTEVNNSGVPETTWYVYDATGQRVRKVTDRSAASSGSPARKTERIYLGTYEIYREYEGDDERVTLERQTVHVMDDRRQIVLVETRTEGIDSSPERVIRYQYGNHLGSSSLELDDQAQVISYEEYFPYGATSYQAVRRDVEVAPKRYRYTGIERDEESGLSYHGARYYGSWLARWTAADPIINRRVFRRIVVHHGTNLYRYTRGNPVKFVDLLGEDETVPDSRSWLQHLAIEVDDAVGPQNWNTIADFAAGFGDTASAGLSSVFRELVGVDDVVDYGSTAYVAGEVTETTLEIAATGASAYLRRRAARATSTAAGRQAIELARKRGVQRAHRQRYGSRRNRRPTDPDTGRQIQGHHEPPVVGHPPTGPGERPVMARYPRPDLADNPRGIRFMEERAHRRRHRYLRRLDRIDQVRARTQPIRAGAAAYRQAERQQEGSVQPDAVQQLQPTQETSPPEAVAVPEAETGTMNRTQNQLEQSASTAPPFPPSRT
jgi:RHS repeat-associated protein